MCIIFHTLGNGYLKFGPDLRGNQTSIQDSLTIKRNCFCNFHWGPFRMYLSDINFGPFVWFHICGEEFHCIIHWEKLFQGK